MNQFFIFVFGFFGFCGLLGCIEFISRKLLLPPEWVRRISHIFAALFTVYFSRYLLPPFLIAGLLMFSLIMFISRVRKIFTHIHGVSRFTIGEELLPLGFVFAYFISKGESALFIPAILIVGIADPCTGIAVSKNKNIIFGVVVFAAVTFLILIQFLNISYVYLAVIAIVVGFVERLSPYGTDNFSVPVATALMLSIL